MIFRLGVSKWLTEDKTLTCSFSAPLIPVYREAQPHRYHKDTLQMQVQFDIRDAQIPSLRSGELTTGMLSSGGSVRLGQASELEQESRILC
jgi:hypothetical protein